MTAISYLKDRNKIKAAQAAAAAKASLDKPALKPVSEPAPKIEDPSDANRGGAAPNLGGTAPMSGATIPGGVPPASAGGPTPNNPPTSGSPVRTPDPVKVGKPNEPLPPPRQSEPPKSPPAATGTPTPKKTVFESSNWSHEAPRTPSPAHPDLPVFERGQFTKGRFETNGEKAWLQSGTKGPGESLSNLPNLSADAKIALKHAEGHAAAIMRQQDIKEATLFVNYPGGPCHYCVSGVSELLPSGSKLWVRFPSKMKNGGVGLGYYESGNPKFIVVAE